MTWDRFLYSGWSLWLLSNGTAVMLTFALTRAIPVWWFRQLAERYKELLAGSEAELKEAREHNAEMQTAYRAATAALEVERQRTMAAVTAKLEATHRVEIERMRAQHARCEAQLAELRELYKDMLARLEGIEHRRAQPRKTAGTAGKE